MKILKTISSYSALIIISIIAALNYKIFVFPNSFAPAGVDGICTMIQYITKTNMGYLSLAINAPLLIFAFFIVDKSFIKRTAAYTLSFSFFTIALNYIDISDFLYQTDSGTSIVLAPIAAGVIRGLLYVVTLKLGASGGGVDIIAAVVKKYNPHFELMNIIFALNAIVALSAYFVYGFKPEPVICSIIYSFVVSTVTKSISAAEKKSIRFEIITENADSLCREISEKLGLTSTVIDARGAYSGFEKKMVICVTDKESVPKLEMILKQYKGAISFESVITASQKIRHY